MWNYIAFLGVQYSNVMNLYFLLFDQQLQLQPTQK